MYEKSLEQPTVPKPQAEKEIEEVEEGIWTKYHKVGEEIKTLVRLEDEVKKIVFDTMYSENPRQDVTLETLKREWMECAGYGTPYQQACQRWIRVWGDASRGTHMADREGDDIIALCEAAKLQMQAFIDKNKEK